ncbi:MAG: hypothetical protein R3D02_16210 [Hyphomicrobiales bacterium]
MFSRRIVIIAGVLMASTFPAAAAGLVVPFEEPSDVIEVQGWPGAYGQERYDPPGVSGAPFGEKYMNEPRPGTHWSPPPPPRPGAWPPRDRYNDRPGVYTGPGYYYGPGYDHGPRYDDHKAQPRPHAVRRVDAGEVRLMLLSRGYDGVRLAEDRGKTYVFSGRDRRDRRVRITVNAYTGEVTKVVRR